MLVEGFGSLIPWGLKQRGRGLRRGPNLQCQKGLEKKEEFQRKLMNCVYVRTECKIYFMEQFLTEARWKSSPLCT